MKRKTTVVRYEPDDDDDDDMRHFDRDAWKRPMDRVCGRVIRLMQVCKESLEDVYRRHARDTGRLAESLEAVSASVGGYAGAGKDQMPHLSWQGQKQAEYPVEQRVDVPVIAVTQQIQVPNDFVPSRLTVIGPAESVDIVRIEVDDTKFVRDTTKADLYFVANDFRGTDVDEVEPGKPIELTVQSRLGVVIPDVAFIFQGLKRKV